MPRKKIVNLATLPLPMLRAHIETLRIRREKALAEAEQHPGSTFYGETMTNASTRLAEAERILAARLSADPVALANPETVRRAAKRMWERPGAILKAMWSDLIEAQVAAKAGATRLTDQAEHSPVTEARVRELLVGHAHALNKALADLQQAFDEINKHCHTLEDGDSEPPSESSAAT